MTPVRRARWAAHTIWCYHRRHIGVIGLVAVVIALVTVGVWVGGRAAGRSAARAAAVAATSAVLRADSTSCDRNQIQRTYDRVDEAAQRRIVKALNAPPSGKRVAQAPLIARIYLGILNCGATYSPDNVAAGGDPIYLQRRDAECFIQLVVTHYFLRESPVTDPRLLRRICATA